MINAAIVSISWWGQKIVSAVQGKSERLRFIRGVSKEPHTVRDFTAGNGFGCRLNSMTFYVIPRCGRWCWPRRSRCIPNRSLPAR